MEVALGVEGRDCEAIARGVEGRGRKAIGSCAPVSEESREGVETLATYLRTNHRSLT